MEELNYFEKSDNQLEHIRSLIIRVGLGYRQLSEKEIISLLDDLAFSIQTLPVIKYNNVDMKNMISLLANLLEKLILLQKEVLQIKDAIDPSKTIVVKLGREYKMFYYNFKLESYIDQQDINKIVEVQRRIEDLIKFFSRKLVYLILAGYQPVVGSIQQPIVQPKEEKAKMEEQQTTT